MVFWELAIYLELSSRFLESTAIILRAFWNQYFWGQYCKGARNAWVSRSGTGPSVYICNKFPGDSDSASAYREYMQPWSGSGKEAMDVDSLFGRKKKNKR